MANALFGWGYRKAITITGSTSGALADYQIPVKVNYGYNAVKYNNDESGGGRGGFYGQLNAIIFRATATYQAIGVAINVSSQSQNFTGYFVIREVSESTLTPIGENIGGQVTISRTGTTGWVNSSYGNLGLIQNGKLYAIIFVITSGVPDCVNHYPTAPYPYKWSNDGGATWQSAGSWNWSFRLYGVGNDSTESSNGLTYCLVYANESCKTDFSDIRFTASDGQTLYSYWLEGKSNSNYALFWVKIPSIPAYPSTLTFYIYYGNPNAISLSTKNAMLFGESFDPTVENTWTTLSGLAFSVTAGGYNENALYCSGGDSWWRADANALYTAPFIVHYKFKFASTGRGASFHFRKTGEDRYLSLARDINIFEDINQVSLYLNSAEYKAYPTINTGVWYTLLIKMDASARLYVFFNGSQIIAPTETCSDNTFAYVDMSVLNTNTLLDSIFIKKWANPEPSFTAFGSQESVFLEQYGGFKVRINGATTEMCLVERGNGNPAYNSKLRVQKGGVIYDLYLVETNDENASKWHIKTPNGVKAVRKRTA